MKNHIVIKTQIPLINFQVSKTPVSRTSIQSTFTMRTIINPFSRIVFLSISKYSTFSTSMILNIRTLINQVTLTILFHSISFSPKSIINITCIFSNIHTITIFIILYHLTSIHLTYHTNQLIVIIYTFLYHHLILYHETQTILHHIGSIILSNRNQIILTVSLFTISRMIV